jgi:hypothetical protein
VAAGGDRVPAPARARSRSIERSLVAARLLIDNLGGVYVEQERERRTPAAGC